jgi:hypothetical protein
MMCYTTGKRFEVELSCVLRRNYFKVSYVELVLF